MRTGPRFVAALVAAGVGAALLSVPALAAPGDGPDPAAVVEAPFLPTSAGFQQQTATTRKPTATTIRRTTATTRKATATTAKKGTATTAKKAAATTAAATTVPPTAPPTVATTLPLPTQVTSLAPITAPPTTPASINDSAATRLVNRVILALVGLAALVALLTFLYWRTTKPVAPALDGLDLMSSRKWLRAKPEKRARLLGEFHTKRGPVADAVIARTNAPTVKVGAAVAAPDAAPVPVMAGGLGALGGGLGALAQDPPSVTGPGAGGASLAADSPSRPGPNGADSSPGPSVEPAFTVVARRPRGDEVVDPSETP